MQHPPGAAIRKQKQVLRGLDPARLDHMLSLTQPLQSHRCRVRPSALQPPWEMGLLGQGWQEKVSLFQASGSRQGRDQTQGSLEEQGHALSIVLHGAEAAEITEWGVPARAQAIPAPVPRPSSRDALWRYLSHGAGLLRTQGNQPSCPLPVLLLAQLAQREAHSPGRTRAVGSHTQTMYRNIKSPQVYS